MGRKKFEETEYDPIEAEARRALARSISRPDNVPEMSREEGRVVPLPQAANTLAIRTPISKSQRAHCRKEKKRSFSCANSEQDAELDAFLLRIEEVTGTHLPFQVIMRAACVNIMAAEEQVLAELHKDAPPACPATFRHAEYAQFEEYWTDILGRALRRVRPHQ